MKQKEETFKKVTKNIKDYIPHNIVQENIRLQKPILFPSTSNKEYSPILIPNVLFEEWPSDEIINSFDFGINSEEKFTDTLNNLIIFPSSLREEATTNLIWLRPNEILTQKKIQSCIIERFPKKNLNEIQNKLNTLRQPEKISRRNSIDVIVNNVLYNKIKLSEGEKKIIDDIASDSHNDFTIIDKETNKPSNIKMDRYYCKFIKWLGSLYQVIIDNAIDNYSFIKNIYPQVEGIPVYNPSGRYWVKLYHMGKYRKIEIDDLFPCNKNSYETFLPQSVNPLELWPMLLSKAIMKLYSYKYRNDKYEEEEVGDCSPLYSLCGYIGYNIDNELELTNKDNDYLNEILNEYNYQTKDKVLIAFTPSKKKKRYINFSLKKFNNIKTVEDILNSSHINIKRYPITKIYSSLKLPSLDVRNDRNIVTIKTEETPTLNKKKISTIPTITIKENKKLDNGIFYDTAYSIVEIFSSGNFNMRRLFPIDFSDLKLNFDKKYKQMLPDEKRIYIQKFRELRIHQKAEKAKRKQEYFDEGENIIIIKFTNSSIDNIENSHKLYEVDSKYKSEEIEMAKYCILNNRRFPKIEFFEGVFLNRIFKDDESGEVNFWTKKFYKKKILEYYDKVIKGEKEKENVEENKEQEEKTKGEENEKEKEVIEEQKEIIPIKRGEGNWIECDKFKESFSTFRNLLNSKKFKNNFFIDNIWYDFDKDLFEEKETSKIIKLIPDTETKTENDITSFSLYIIFEPNGEKNCKSVSSGLGLPQNSDYKTNNKFDDICYSISIQLYVINENKEIVKTDKYISLNKLFSVYELKTIKSNEEYIMIIKGGVTPFGFTLNLYSNAHKFMNYSYSQFLVDFKKFIQKKLHVSYPILPKNKYFLMMRARIIYNNKDAQNKTSNFFTNIENFEDKTLRQSINIFLINCKTNKKKQLALKEQFVIDFTENNNYLLEMSIFPPYDIPEKAFEYELLYNNPDISIDKIEVIQPFEITERYTLNRHQIIFNELIYPTEYALITMDINLEYRPIVNTDENNEKTETIANKAPLTDDFSNIPKVPLPDKIKMKFEFFHGDTLIFSKDFYDNTLVRNLELKYTNTNPNPNPKDPKSGEIIPYCIKCSLSVESAPSYLLIPSEYKNDFYWNIGVFSSDPILFVKNTIKEDIERKVIESWEINQPGRKAKAKISRQKYFIMKKKESGEPLLDEEKELIDEKKDTIKSESKMIITEVLPNNNNVNINKVNLPKIENHSSLFIKNFCAYSTGERVITINKLLPIIEVKCKDEEEREKEKEKINEIYENYYKRKEEENNKLKEISNYNETEINGMAAKLSDKRKRFASKNNLEIKTEMQRVIENIKKKNEIKKLCLKMNQSIQNNEVTTNTFDIYYSELKQIVELDKTNKEFESEIKEISEYLTKLKEEIITKELASAQKVKKETFEKHLNQIKEKILLVNEELVEKLSQKIKKM